MTRCEHGVYLPAWAVDGMNPYCSACGNFGKVVNEKNVILPHRTAELDTDRVLANIHGHGCPACGSAVWVRVNEEGSDSKRECGECGVKYTKKLSAQQQANLQQEEMNQCLA